MLVNYCVCSTAQYCGSAERAVDVIQRQNFAVILNLVCMAGLTRTIRSYNGGLIVRSTLQLIINDSKSAIVLLPTRALLRSVYSLTGHGRFVLLGKSRHERLGSHNSVRSALNATRFWKKTVLKCQLNIDHGLILPS